MNELDRMMDITPDEVSEFSDKLMTLRWLSKKNLADELNEYQLTPSQYVTLRVLEENPDGISMTDLARDVHHVSPTMTGIIQRLEHQGLVERFPMQEDRRKTLVRLTQTGAQILDIITAAKRIRFEGLLQQLTVEEKKQLFSIMEKATLYFRSMLRG